MMCSGSFWWIFHDTWVHCWRWNFFIKVWVNMFKIFVRDQVIICVVIEFILFNLIILRVLFLCINKVIVFMMIVHMTNMIIWVLKLDRVFFWTREKVFCLSRTCVFGCIFIFIEVLWSWSMFIIFLEELFSGCICMYVQWSSEGAIL